MEKNIKNFLQSYMEKDFKLIESFELKEKEIQIVVSETKDEIMNNFKKGFATPVDPDKEYYLYFSRSNLAIYLFHKRINDTSSIFASMIDHTKIISDDKFYVGKEIDMNSADLIINNYLTWIGWVDKKKIPAKLNSEKQHAFELVRKSGYSLETLSEELRGDKEIVLEAVKNKGGALGYANEELKGNKEVVLEAVKNNGNALDYASKELRGDREVVLEAVKNNGNALEYASEELRGDKKVVLEALKDNYLALEYASEELRGNKEVVLEAAKVELYALTYANEKLWNDREFINGAYQIDQYALLYIPEKYLEDHMNNSSFKNTYIKLVKSIQKEKRMEKTKEFLTLTAARWGFF